MNIENEDLMSRGKAFQCRGETSEVPPQNSPIQKNLRSQWSEIQARKRHNITKNAMQTRFTNCSKNRKSHLCLRCTILLLSNNQQRNYNLLTVLKNNCS